LGFPIRQHHVAVDAVDDPGVSVRLDFGGNALFFGCGHCPVQADPDQNDPQAQEQGGRNSLPHLDLMWAMLRLATIPLSLFSIDFWPNYLQV
jgi:hypothetical protein